MTTLEQCPACYENVRSLHGEKNGYPVFRCRGCGTLYCDCSPMDYDGYYDESNLAIPEFIKKRLEQVFRQLDGYRRTNRLLDIGCGAGLLLEVARRAGWQAEGVEISQTAAEHVRSEGFNVFVGDLGEAPYPDHYFDVVIASELIEHVPDPLATLRHTARILRPGGLFWATTPNASSFSARILGVKWSTVCPPEHLQLFSANGIRKLSARAGFRRVRVYSTGCNPFEIVHGLRSKGDVSPGWNDKRQNGAGFNRVASSYKLNAALLRNPLTRGIKAAANGALALTGLGDTIRLQAEK